MAPAGSDIVRGTLRRLGLEVHRYPGPGSLLDVTGKVIARHQIDLVLDVGANVGQYATAMRGSGYRGRIVSIEPVPEAFARLQAAAASDAAWDVRQLALGAEAGELELNVAASTSVSSFLRPTDDYVAGYADGRTIRQEPVVVARLDEVIDDLAGSAQRILLKCDTQGFDLEVIRGAAGVLDRIVAIQSELSIRPIYDRMTGYLDAIAEIQGLGYDPVGFFTVVSDADLRAVEIDGLFTRVER